MKTALLMLTMVTLCCDGYAAKKPKLIVQVSAIDLDVTSAISVVAYLILPDGSHAKGRCVSVGERPCDPESFTPEKRPADVCKVASNNKSQHCEYRENYYADRNGNDITLYAANGKVVFHITGSW